MVDVNRCSPCDFEDDGEDMLDNFLYERINEQQAEIKTKLSKIVRQDSVEDFAKILAAAYLSDNCEAMKIAEELDLDQEHFISIDDNYDFNDYKKNYNKSQRY